MNTMKKALGSGWGARCARWMWRGSPALAVVLAGCGPDWVVVDYSFTIANLSSYDLTSAAVCFSGLDGESCVTYAGGIAAGATGNGESTFLAQEGEVLYVSAAARDTYGDGYLWDRDYTITGGALDVSVVFTDDSCCYDF